MDVHTLLNKIGTTLLIVQLEEHCQTDEQLEAMLERVKFLWLAERPLKLHTDN